MPFRSHVGISADPLSIDAAMAFLADPAVGGTVLFTGTVRNHAEGRAVTALEYEAFVERAQPALHTLAADAHTRWPELCAVWMEHRTGRLEIGEPAVVVGAAAAHREQAFCAARWLIDTLKDTVPIWKKELWADGGAHWPGTPEAGAPGE